MENRGKRLEKVETRRRKKEVCDWRKHGRIKVIPHSLPREGRAGGTDIVREERLQHDGCRHGGGKNEECVIGGYEEKIEIEEGRESTHDCLT